MSGTLTIVATPIGNLGDMSPRAVDTLRAVDHIYAEDTRTFRKLANHFEIETPCSSFHDHNESAATPTVLKRLEAGENIALLSDAGTPTISDPGYRLVKACKESGIKVTTTPGPCAAIAALSISGFEAHRFTFEGFLSPKPGKRARSLQGMLESEGATILYESPHRVLKTLQAIADLAPTRDLFIARELTKLHEECVRGSATELLHHFQKAPAIRGEFVIVIRGVTD